MRGVCCLLVSLVLVLPASCIRAAFVQESRGGGGADASGEGAINDAARDVALDGTDSSDKDHLTDYTGPADTSEAGPTLCKWTSLSSGTSQELFGVHGTASTDVWAVGAGGTIRHYDGTGWKTSTSNTTADLLAVWALSASDVWAAGASGTVAHYDGSKWTASSISNKPLIGIWGSATNAVWAVGDLGTVMRFDGTSWSPQSAPANSNLNAVWGSAANDIWAVGPSAVIIHYDGTSWTPVSGIPGHNYHGVSGRSKTEAWIAGRVSIGGINYPVALQLTGAGWSDNSPIGSDMRLYAAWVDPATGEVWTTGRQASDQGPIFHHDGNWVISHTASAVLNGIWGTSDCDVWAVGGGGAIFHRAP